MMRRLVICAALCLSALIYCDAACGDPPSVHRPKKLIEAGWDAPDVAQLGRALPQIEKRPFDGLMFDVEAAQAPARLPFGRLFANEPWSRSWFEPAIADLKKLTAARPLEKFVRVAALPGGVDWFDDAGWRNITAHWRIVAWTVRQAGLKGIAFDPEAYHPEQAVFRYGVQPQRAKRDFAQYAAQARRRGREVMQAIAEECPDPTILCLFLNSACGAAAVQGDPQAVLHGHLYGLLPAFLDGWLDAAPPTLTVVDGCEDAYLFNSPEQYLQAAHLIRGPCQELVSPENRAKYRAQVQVGFGVYLDAYWNPKSSPWHVDALGGAPAARLGANVASALYAADEYVWIYGERFRWWPTNASRVEAQSWPEVLPFCDEYLRCARDPLGYARDRIGRQRASGKLASAVRNGGFDRALAPADWVPWPDASSQAELAWDELAGCAKPGSARVQKAQNNGLLQTLAVNPGERYVVRAKCKLRGDGDALLRIGWQTAPGRWNGAAPERAFFAGGSRTKWRELFGVVEVPAGTTRLAILLSAYGQTTPDAAAWFDDVEMFPLIIELRD